MRNDDANVNAGILSLPARSALIGRMLYNSFISLSTRSRLGLLRTVVRTLMVWQERSRLRRYLRNLSDDLLDDIGLSRADVEARNLKPSWQV